MILSIDSRKIQNKIELFWTANRIGVILQPFLYMKQYAQVAELVDAADSKSAVRKDVSVRFRSWARAKGSLFKRAFLIKHLL